MTKMEDGCTGMYLPNALVGERLASVLAGGAARRGVFPATLGATGFRKRCHFKVLVLILQYECSGWMIECRDVIGVCLTMARDRSIKICMRRHCIICMGEQTDL